MRLAFILTALLGIGLPAPPAGSEELTPEAVNAAEFKKGAGETADLDPLVLKAQILLDRAGMSPGAIDGRAGENYANAIAAFEKRNGLASDGKLDDQVWALLTKQEDGEVLATVELTPDDVEGKFVGRIPDDYSELAKMERLGFADASEMMAERFHMHIDLFKRLNKGKDLSPGTRIVVAAVDGPLPEEKPDLLEVDKAKSQLRALDGEGRLLIAYPATIGGSDSPSPSGEHTVKGHAANPVYYYRPDVNFQQGDNSEPLEIPPGPNNPVGSMWIDLSEPTYGIHGTPDPEEIGKTASHGCVRLTNWDAEELAKLVQSGLRVKFLN